MVNLKKNLHDTMYLTSILSKREHAFFNMLEPYRRRDWLAGRVALKRSYIQDSGSSLSQVDVLNSAQGVPYIAQSKINCSISHSHGTALAAVSTELVGVDIELVKHRTTTLRIHICDKSEEALLRQCYQGSELTTVAWVIKESILKALGIGLQGSFGHLKITHLEYADANWLLWRTSFAGVDWVSRVKKHNHFIIGLSCEKNALIKKINWY